MKTIATLTFLAAMTFATFASAGGTRTCYTTYIGNTAYTTCY